TSNSGGVLRGITNDSRDRLGGTFVPVRFVSARLEPGIGACNGFATLDQPSTARIQAIARVPSPTASARQATSPRPGSMGPANAAASTGTVPSAAMVATVGPPRPSQATA